MADKENIQQSRKELLNQDSELTEMRKSLVALFNSINGLDPDAMLRRFDAYGQQMYNFGYSAGRYTRELEEGQLEMAI